MKEKKYRIEIQEKPTVEFYDEFLYVAAKYREILKKPKLKAKRLTREIEKYILYVLVCGMLLFLLKRNNMDILSIVLWIILLLYLVLAGIFLWSVQRKIKMYFKNLEPSVIEINSTGVALKKRKQTVSISWNSIAAIMIYHYSICLLPKDASSIMIGFDVEYKEEFLKAVTAYKRQNLVIDNSNLYCSDRRESFND